MTPPLPLAPLTRRLAECPYEFLLPPRGSSDGAVVDTLALVSDVLRKHGEYPPDDPNAFVARLKDDRPTTDRLRLIGVACWLLADDSLVGAPNPARPVEKFLTSEVAALAGVLKPEYTVHDPDRREELARKCLAALGVPVAGETPAQSADRLTTLDSIERSKVVAQTRAAEARARELRRKAAEDAAKAAAARYSPE